MKVDLAERVFLIGFLVGIFVGVFLFGFSVIGRGIWEAGYLWGSTFCSTAELTGGQNND